MGCSSLMGRVRVWAGVVVFSSPRFGGSRGGAGDRAERGAATVMLVFVAVALLAVAGLVIDGGYALGAKREAMNSAEQAARVGSDALSESALRSGRARVNPGQAIAAAQSYLHRVGTTGSVAINGGTVTVTVSTHQRTAILSAVGVTSIPVKATASAESIDQEHP